LPPVGFSIKPLHISPPPDCTRSPILPVPPPSILPALPNYPSMFLPSINHPFTVNYLLHPHGLLPSGEVEVETTHLAPPAVAIIASDIFAASLLMPSRAHTAHLHVAADTDDEDAEDPNP
jgi:hypothetical protein